MSVVVTVIRCVRESLLSLVRICCSSSSSLRRCELIVFCLCTGVDVSVSGIKRSTLEHTTKKFVEMFSALPRPLHACTQSTENPLDQPAMWTTSDESEALILEMVCAEIAEYKNKDTRLRMSPLWIQSSEMLQELWNAQDGQDEGSRWYCTRYEEALRTRDHLDCH